MQRGLMMGVGPEVRLGERPRVAVVGAGAVGGYYGARLAQRGHRVGFLMRGDYGVVRERGLVVRMMREKLERGVVAESEKYLTRGERVAMVGGDLWACFRRALNESSLVRVLGSKRLGVGTVRNWNTVRRLGAMVEELRG